MSARNGVGLRHQNFNRRVRHHLAKHFSSVATNLGISNNPRFPQEQSLVMACFVSLLTDSEAEVRASATSHLARMISWGGQREFTLHLQPLLPALADDVVMEVRCKTALAIMEAAAASSSTGTAKVSGEGDPPGSGDSLEDAVIIQVFGPLLESFLGDEFHEVQLQVLTNLHKIAHLLPGLTPVVTSLLHMSKASNWRVREAVAKLLPHLATARGVDFFSTVLLEPAWLTLLLDPVAQVRSAICSGMPLLVEVAGPEWITSQLLPHHARIYNTASSSYLVRMTLLQAHIEMAMATTDDTLWCDAVAHVLRGLQDKVANVRMVSARGLGKIVFAAHTSELEVLSSQMRGLVASQVRPALEKIRDDEDWDCRQIGQAALDQINAAI
jgi:serine/threonine-protein phosphatase 2A regulatory subunit A